MYPSEKLIGEDHDQVYFLLSLSDAEGFAFVPNSWQKVTISTSFKLSSRGYLGWNFLDE